jgi:EAL domain-containing protein (putative c-di-GMP-specific phosphodiesterase class I)/ActR/RegA family two-component response regulator
MPPEISVLLVEDHAFQRSLAMRLVRGQGVTDVLDASDGLAALALLRERGRPVDLALVDLDLPGMDGIELIRELAAARLVGAVALVSAMDASVQHTVSLVAKASGLRMLGIVEKPLTPEKLEGVFKAYASDAAGGEGAYEGVESEAEVRSALEAGDIEPWFQPQAELVNGRIVGVEALARWRKADGGMVPPATFIPVLERLGLSAELTRITLRRTGGFWRQWSEAGLRLRVSVNVSAADLDDLHVADEYERLVQAAGIPADCVVFEVTESALLRDMASGLAALARLRLKGFGLSIDDFGTGYSSMSQLAQIPFTELKIDRSFVAGAPNEAKKAQMISATLELARRMKLSVVAEGIEHADEWQLLAREGCELGQGYLIGKAVPGEALAEAVFRWRYVQE